MWQGKGIFLASLKGDGLQRAFPGKSFEKWDGAQGTPVVIKLLYMFSPFLGLKPL